MEKQLPPRNYILPWIELQRQFDYMESPSLYEVFELCGEEDRMLYIPEGFAHGFMALEDGEWQSADQYFERVLRSSGIIDALIKAGVKQGDTVSVYDVEFDYVP